MMESEALPHTTQSHSEGGPIKTMKTILSRKSPLLPLTCLCLAASLFGPLVPAHALSVAGGGTTGSSGGATAPSAPTITTPPPPGPVQSTGQNGAPVTLSATVTSPTGAGLTVQWTVDGVVAQTTVFLSGTTQTGATTTFTQTYAPGPYTVVVIVSDGVNPPVSALPITVTVLAPTNTGSAKVTGGGNIALATDKGTFGFVAKTNAAGSPQGNFVFQDHVTGRTVKSLEITGLIVLGTHAEFWGKAMINDDGEYDFVVDVDDFAEPGAGVDTFALQTGDGCAVGGILLSGGNIQVHK